MDRLNEIREMIKTFIDEKYQIKKEISKIETKRIELAEERNSKKYSKENMCNDVEIYELGQEIARLGNQSQQLQNKLDSRYLQIRSEVNMHIDNLITERIRQIRRAKEEQQELQENYEISKNIDKEIEKIEEELQELARNKIEVKNNNFSKIVEENKKEELEELPITQVIEIGEIENEAINEIEPMKELEIENIQEIGEIEIDKLVETSQVKSIAREIDEIVDNIIKADQEKEIITFEETNKEQKIEEKITEKVKILSIIAKVENAEIVYKAQLNNNKVISIYAKREENLIEKSKEIRNLIKMDLLDYAVVQYKMLDKKVIKKIDPIICQILTEFAEEYGYDGKELMYQYAMSFSDNNEETDVLPPITYNFSFINEAELTKKEKEYMQKVVRNAKKNENIEIIGYRTNFTKIKYVIKRIFNLNNSIALPERKYE